jgi:transmembrane sensor
MNTQVREEAAAWLIEFRTEEADAAARERFADWLRASPAHVSAYLKLASVWEEAADLPPASDLDSLIRLARAEDGNVVLLEARAPSDPHPVADIAPSNSEPGSGRRTPIASSPHPRRRNVWVAAAAMAAIAMTAAWFALTRDPVYSTQLGEQRTLELADGSTVALNARSKIRVSFRPKERQVTLLEGQALFNVVRNALRPFVVVAGVTRVEDVGTQFAVARNATSTVVTVIEGRVAVLPMVGHASSPRSAVDSGAPAGAGSASPEPASVSNTIAGPALFLSAGEQATVTGHSAKKTDHPNIATATAWTQQQLVFDSTPLSEAADAFNRFNVRQLRVEGAALQEFHISGTFSARDPASLSRFLLFLRDQPGIVVEESDGQIIVKPK